MRLLLDSHAVYWWMTGSVRLSETARELIADDANTLLVSAVSIYEIELKAKRRRVDLPPQQLRAALRRNVVEELAITHDHAEYAAPSGSWKCGGFSRTRLHLLGNYFSYAHGCPLQPEPSNSNDN